MAKEEVILQIENVKKHFGAVKAVDGFSIDIRKGDIIGLIGPNGAGKTTLLNCILGSMKVDEGWIYFNNEPIHGVAPHKIAEKGVTRTYQVPRPFPKLTVLESVLTTVAARRKRAFGIRVKEKAKSLLEFVGLSHMTGDYSGELSGGQQRLLEFARALMSDPQLMLMDEPFAGVFPEVKERLIKSIKEVNKHQVVTFFIVSHDVTVMSKICEHIVVMHLGKKFAEGPSKEVLADKSVIKVYLGS
ncbi:MAG: ABC transporter ATP-binding protein [Candidatus Heimdallarchaeota archaeon]